MALSACLRACGRLSGGDSLKWFDMTNRSRKDQNSDSFAFLEGGGEMGRFIRSMDWSQTPLGPIESWPQSLRTTVSLCLASNFPISMAWGPKHVQIYNDGYWPICGGKHPKSMGQDFTECWASAMPVIGEAFNSALAGRAQFIENQRMFLDRNGYLEETFFTFSFSPIRDESGGVGGLFHPVTETTPQMLSQRRTRALRDLAARTGKAKSVQDALLVSVEVLAEFQFDLPFVLLYLVAENGKEARLVGSAGLEPGPLAATTILHGEGPSQAWPIGEVVLTGRPLQVDDVEPRVGNAPCGPYPEPPKSAFLLPISPPGSGSPAAVLVVGVSPRLPFDDAYRNFLDLLAAAITAAVANARAYEDEKRRAEALAEIDRAKTAFFSNVSHEFRTPLTLMLGPVEDLLTRGAADLPPSAKSQIEIVNRNGLRLLRLVNTLLDFSRIEAGRVRATYQPTDLGAVTADLASNFRAACERAGLRLVVNCPTLNEPVFVDRGMWEKIVLNLVSNAFKFTLEGEIVVALRRAGDAALLEVKDTGTGIPAAEMPRLFERFHRVENARGRTHEGSGIGLALVQELVKLHGGSIWAESAVGQGTSFTVSIPLGSAHLPIDQVGNGRSISTTDVGAVPYVEEALRWLPEDPSNGHGLPEFPAPRPSLPARRRMPDEQDADRPLVLIADDNADMRQYIVRLLAGQYRTLAVPDGEAALVSAREHSPEVILTDVMMPRLDGFGLLQELRADPQTRGIPVIMLSARAGEESRVEGMEAGADDYLVKPFGARELLARVSAHLQMSRLRREASEAVRAQERELREAQRVAHVGSWRWDPASDVTTGSAELFRIFGLDPDTQTFPDFKKQDGTLYPHESWRRINEAVRETLRTGVGYELDVQAYCNGEPIWITTRGEVVKDAAGKVIGLRGTVQDITERQRVEEALRRAESQLRVITDALPTLISYVDADGIYRLNNRAYEEWFKHTRTDITGHHMRDVLGEAAWRIVGPKIEAALAGETVTYEAEVDYKDAGRRWINPTYVPHFDAQGKVTGVAVLVSDVTQRKRAEEAQRRSEERLRLLWEAAAVLLTTDEPDAMLRSLFSKIAPHLGLDTYFNFMVNESGNGLKLASCIGVAEETARTFENLAFGQAICGTVAMVRKPLTATYIQQSADPKAQLVKSLGIRAYACNPLMAGDELLGTLSFASRSRDSFDAEELDFLQTICQYVTAAYERLRLIGQLRNADRRKDEFLATLAHELRNPLAPIRNGLQILRLGGASGEMADDARNMMERQLNQMVRLIDDLLDLSRISRGKIELRKDRVELAKVVQQAVETSRPVIEQADHELLIDAPAGPIYVDADVTRLAQVFSNLLNNAAKYTERGGRIHLSVQRRGAEALVSVKDNGLGIPAHMLPKVFDMFTQVDRNLERAQGGLGIGLSIVKRLVEMHGGSVEAKSDGHGMGSEFVVRLPVVLSVAQPSDADEPAGGAAARRRVLVVDDNRDAAMSLAMMLKLMGSEVKTAHDGMEALDVAAVFRPDLVLLDIGMPRLNGHETARRIREQPWAKNVVLVALTGWGQEEDRRRSEEAGFDSHMVKPIEPRALEKLLSRLHIHTA
jgi:PAS domain S-box-containing protein